MSMRRGDGILKILIIAFLLIVMGNAIEYFFINKNDLKKVEGKVSEVILKTYDCPGESRFSKSTCEKTIIILENVKGSFRVSDLINQGAYIDEIEEGDDVTIYLRNWYQYFLTFGSGRDIYGLEKNGVVYYNMERWKASNKAFMLLFGILSVFFGALYILQRVTMNQLESKNVKLEKY